MPRVCTVCQHPEKAAIDKALVAGQPAQSIAALYRVSDDALLRHKAAHLAPLVRQARDSAEAAQTLDIAKQLRAINGVTLAILDEARRSGDRGTVLRAVDRVQRQLELQARLIGELDDRPTVNVLLAPEWLSVRGVVLTALGPYPEARAAVAQQLLSLEPAPHGHR